MIHSPVGMDIWKKELERRCGGSGIGHVTLEWYSVVLAQVVRVFSSAAVVCAMGKHMDEQTKALCYFYRNPPAGSGVNA